MDPTIGALIAEIGRLDDALLHPGASPAKLREWAEREGMVLPDDHLRLLQASNGFEAYAGYLRLFGVGKDRGIELARWNDHGDWKFAWGDLCSDFYCFAETGWGNQYAYRISDLRGRRDESVYFLSAVSMEAERIASSVREFMETEFLPSAREPYDSMLVLARRRFGPLPLEQHVVHVPSILITGTEDIRNAMQMDARAGMICSGDIWTQCANAEDDAMIVGVVPYEDDAGRPRVRMLWAGG